MSAEHGFSRHHLDRHAVATKAELRDTLDTTRTAACSAALSLCGLAGMTGFSKDPPTAILAAQGVTLPAKDGR